MKTQYILKLQDTVRSAVVDKPEIIYWNRGKQITDNVINPVSVFFLFRNSPKMTNEQIEEQAYEENAYTVEIDDFENMTQREFRDRLMLDASSELEKFDTYAEYNKLNETNFDYFCKERGDLIYLLDRFA